MTTDPYAPVPASEHHVEATPAVTMQSTSELPPPVTHSRSHREYQKRVAATGGLVAYIVLAYFVY
jgi:hypothetical protein